MMTQEGVSNKDLDDFESYIMKAQEEEEEQEEEDITSSSSSDELDAMEKLVMNAKEESEEPFSEEPLYSMSNGLDDLEDMIEGAKEQDKDENRVNPYDTDTTPDNVQIDISTTTLTENKVTTNVAEYQQEQMEEEEERLDELLFALSDANGLEPASQSSVRSKSPPPRISAVSSSRVQNGQPESSSIITSHVETHHNGVEPEDSMFENMEIHESEIPLPVQPPRKKVKRQLPESLPHDITRRSGLPTAESAR
ncbi:hypothetical protein BGW37DRAFT_234990 [Umbelopsis sp. PMI_123]|nr:hypothetical protein BGW37DRAFT_234990 [Umbelopsis sp. PMI_123]